MPDTSALETRFLKDLWEDREAHGLADKPLELLTYRSNLLGADLRITNFGGGNTSSKFELPDPISGKPTRVLAVKGSGGDLRSIDRNGFAILYLDKLEQLISRYRGEEHEDEMVELYPICAFGMNRVAASIDTPLHAFLPFEHVDHLHPDWAIALAASANGTGKLREFNDRFARKLIWIPWQRPGFELAMMMRQAVKDNPAAEGIVLGSHGLFTWGRTQRSCYANSIRTIDQLGEFVQGYAERSARPAFGGPAVNAATDRDSTAAAILPYLRGAVSSNRRLIAHYESSQDALEFANSHWAQELSELGTSCPDHFLRTRICPMFVPWDPASEDVPQLKNRIGERIEKYRKDYSAYYQLFAQPDSPPLRDTNPTVVVIPALGIFGFAKDKREARITTEFFTNAIHVMAGANALDERPAKEITFLRPKIQSNPANSRASIITSRYQGPNPFGLNIGRLKKQNCAACRLRASVAGKSPSSSEGEAVLGGRWRCRSRGTAGTLWWRIRIAKQLKRCRKRRQAYRMRRW